MKIAFAFLASAALIFSFSSCDSHPWEETKDLHEGMHAAHGNGTHAGHETTVDHAKPEHAEKPKVQDHGAPAAEAKPATEGAEKKAH